MWRSNAYFWWKICWERETAEGYTRYYIYVRCLIFTTTLLFGFISPTFFFYSLQKRAAGRGIYRWVSNAMASALLDIALSLQLLLPSTQSLKGAQRLRPTWSNSISLPSNFSTKPPEKRFLLNFFLRSTFRTFSSIKFFRLASQRIFTLANKWYIIESWISFQMTWWLVVKKLAKRTTFNSIKAKKENKLLSKSHHPSLKNTVAYHQSIGLLKNADCEICMR